MATANSIDTGARAEAVSRCLAILLEAAQRRRQRQAEQDKKQSQEKQS